MAQKVLSDLPANWNIPSSPFVQKEEKVLLPGSIEGKGKEKEREKGATDEKYFSLFDSENSSFFNQGASQCEGMSFSGDQNVNRTAEEKDEVRTYQRTLKPLNLPQLQTDPSPTLWTVFKFLYRFEQAALNFCIKGEMLKRYFVNVVNGPTKSVLQSKGILNMTFKDLQRCVLIMTCGSNWKPEAEVSWRNLKQGSMSMEAYLEMVNIFKVAMDLDPNSYDFRVVFRMSLQKEYQTALEQTFGFLETWHDVSWVDLQEWLCAVRRTGFF